MAETNWSDILNFSEAQLEDIRFAGYCYIKQGVYDLATTFFEALVVLNPLSLYDLQTLGALHLQKGNYTDALLYLDKALTINPKSYPTKLNRTKALFLSGEKEQALAQAEELKNCPDKNVAMQASSLILNQ